jgi:hypothetical protein
MGGHGHTDVLLDVPWDQQVRLRLGHARQRSAFTNHQSTDEAEL